MKQAEVKTDRQTTHRIFDRICGHGTGCIALQPDKDLVRSRVSWPNVATDKRAVCANTVIAGQAYCRTTKRINNRIIVRTSLRMCLRLSRFNNLETVLGWLGGKNKLIYWRHHHIKRKAHLSCIRTCIRSNFKKRYLCNI
jgi:hypothetical protein